MLIWISSNIGYKTDTLPTSYEYLFQPIKGAAAVATAMIQMIITMANVLLLVTLHCLFLVMEVTTVALSKVNAVKNQMPAMAQQVETEP